MSQELVNAPRALEPLFDHIPNELKSHPQWVVWRYEQDDKGSWRKPLFTPKTGRAAKANTPATWGSFDQAMTAYLAGGWAGIGFVFSLNDPYAGIDLDKCRDKQTGKVTEWAMKIIRAFGSYTEVSPSGTGVKIIVKGALPGPGVNNRKLRIEIYDRRHYFTLTGHVLAGGVQQ